MLKLQPNPTFDAKVMVPVVGGPDEEITLTFRHKGVAAIKEFAERAKTADDVDSVSELVAGWNGVDAEFNRDNLAQLLDAYPSLSARIIEAWFNEIASAKTKN